MSNGTWRIKEKGKDDLGCLLKEHQMCESTCETCKPPMDMGHCYSCGMIVVHSENTLLEPIKLYFF